MKSTELRIGNWVNYYSNNIVWGEVRVSYNTFKTFEQIEAHPNYEFKELLSLWFRLWEKTSRI